MTIIKLYAIATLLFVAKTISAQESKDFKTLPLHFEASLGTSTSHHDLMPTDMNLDLNYTFWNKLSLHIVSQTSNIIPKAGLTTNFNRVDNLGGGAGYLISSQKDDNLGDFEIRTFVSRSLNNSNLKNTSYNIGVHWYSHANRHKLCPTVGIGYNFKDFSNSNLKNYSGVYCSLGVRF